MASRYRMHNRLSQRQRTSLRLRYMGGTALLASAIGLQIFLLGNLGDTESLLAQSSDGNNVASYRVDLSGNPEGVFVSPPMVRSGSGCNAGPTERCLSFTVLVDRDAEGLVFEQIAGDKPSGSTLYYIDCDKAAALGEPVCLPENNGKITLTYCASGTQTCVYRISSMGRVRMKADTAGTIGDPLKFNIAGLVPSTVKWTSVYPGKQGSFDSYLQPQSSPNNVVMTPDEKCPEKMKFEISGTHRNACGDAVAYVDTIDVTLYSHLTAQATPNNAVCADGGTVVLNVQALGGKAPYDIKWKDPGGKVIASAAECSVHAPGNYSVQITDSKNTTVTQTVSVLTAKVSLPASVTVNDIKQENALVAWQPMPQATRFAVRSRAAGTTSWTYRKADGSASEAKLKDLQPGQTYELQLMAYGAGNDSSGWSATQTFSTEGPCVNASNLRYKIRSGNAWFYWTQNPYNTKQELVIRKKGAGDWERSYKFGSKVNSAVLDNLKAGVEYEWAIKSHCPAGNYSGAKDFTVSEAMPVSLSGAPGDMASAQR